MFLIKIFFLDHHLIRRIYIFVIQLAEILKIFSSFRLVPHFIYKALIRAKQKQRYHHLDLEFHKNISFMGHLKNKQNICDFLIAGTQHRGT